MRDFRHWRERERRRRRWRLHREWQVSHEGAPRASEGAPPAPPPPAARLDDAPGLDARIAPKVDASGLSRCPFCHGDVPRLDGVVCATCLARHHEPCWDEHGACAACGAAERFARVERTAPPPREKT